MADERIRTRRQFLRDGLTLASCGAFARRGGGAAGSIVRPTHGTARGRARAAVDGRALVIVHLAGGNDGLNTIVPFRRDAYYRSRPHLALARHGLLRISDELGFHPAAVGLKRLFDEGLLAIVQGVGYPNPKRSHLQSMDVWDTALPDSERDDGWMERHLGPVRRRRDAGGTRQAFVQALRNIERLVAAGSPDRVYRVSLGGFDTHSAQQDRQPPLLAQLGEGLTAFVADLNARGNLERVALMVFSEFGRTIGENGSRGTDHGGAAPVFVVGGRVAGGVYGEHPDLDGADGGDLPYTVDFRRVCAGILRDWLETDAAGVLGGRFEPLKLLRT